MKKFTVLLNQGKMEVVAAYYDHTNFSYRFFDTNNRCLMQVDDKIVIAVFYE